MDLHDYKDAAENYDRHLEVMYAHEEYHDIFREFCLDPARKYGAGGVAGVACGTGAVLLYLAELCGFEVTDIYRGYNGDREDLKDPSSAAKYRSNLIRILKRKDCKENEQDRNPKH